MCSVCYEPPFTLWRPVHLEQCEHLFCWHCLSRHVVCYVEHTCDAWLSHWCPLCRVRSSSAVLLGVVGRENVAHVFVHGAMIAVQQLHSKQSSSTQKARKETRECERLDAVAYEELEDAVEAQVGLGMRRCMHGGARWLPNRPCRIKSRRQKACVACAALVPITWSLIMLWQIIY